jgi:hypothetical protein
MEANGEEKELHQVLAVVRQVFQENGECYSPLRIWRGAAEPGLVAIGLARRALAIEPIRGKTAR